MNQVALLSELLFMTDLLSRTAWFPRRDLVDRTPPTISALESVAHTVYLGRRDGFPGGVFNNSVRRVIHRRICPTHHRGIHVRRDPVLAHGDAPQGGPREFGAVAVRRAAIAAARLLPGIALRAGHVGYFVLLSRK